MTELVLPSGTRIGVDPEGARRFLFQGARLVNPSPRPERKRVPHGDKVRVLAVVHGWFPYLAAGSERMLQHMLDALPRDEFEVHILSAGATDPRQHGTEYEYEGVGVTLGYNPPFTPDLIVTHHGPSARVCTQLKEEFPGVPLVAVFHNERLDIPDILALNADLNVYNTKWVKKAIGENGIVIHPPLEYERHHVDKTGNAVTLVNLQKNKGVDTLHRLCSLMPDVKFLGVTGSHGKQEPMPFHNLEVLPTTQDMREVWSRTKVLLAPSEYESFGMVAAEACVSGIPTIAHPTPGLVECLGFAGIFVDRDDTATYERVLRRLLTDRQMYEEHSAMAFERGRQIVVQTQRELTRFVNAVRKLVR
jgi:glycosyltransferase involved in cell wall biosynthesis